MIILSDTDKQKLKEIALKLGIPVIDPYYHDAIPSDKWFVDLIDLMYQKIDNRLNDET